MLFRSRGFMAPPETPKEIVDKLEAAFKKVYENPEFIKVVEDELGFGASLVGSDELEKFVVERYPIQKGLNDLIKE